MQLLATSKFFSVRRKRLPQENEALVEEGLVPETHLFELNSKSSAKGDDSMSTDNEVDKSVDGTEETPDNVEESSTTADGPPKEVEKEPSNGVEATPEKAEEKVVDDSAKAVEEVEKAATEPEKMEVEECPKKEDEPDSARDTSVHSNEEDDDVEENDALINLNAAEDSLLGHDDEDDVSRREEELILKEDTDIGGTDDLEETKSDHEEELASEKVETEKEGSKPADVHVEAESSAEPQEKKEENKEGGEKQPEEEQSTKEKDAEGADKDSESATQDGEKKQDGADSKANANLWVSNLSQNTKATDLRRLFSRHGKLVGAKIVTSARTPGARCYGYVTMANKDDAERCIQFLHRVELHSRIISVEWAKNDGSRPPTSRRSPAREGNKSSTTSTTHRDRNEGDADRKSRTTTRSPRRRTPPRGDVLSFSKIKEERERQRARDHERRQRDISKQRREQEEEARLRERERRQRSEAARLEKEKTRLRLEREKIEREREELMRLERDRQRLERERLDREKEELRRQKKKLETVSSRGSGTKRPQDDKSAYPSKRSNMDKDALLEPPPPPRFGGSDRSRDRFSRSSGKYDRDRHVDDRRKDDSSRSSSRYESTKDSKSWSGNGSSSQYKSYGSGYNREVWSSSRPDSHWSSESGNRCDLPVDPVEEDVPDDMETARNPVERAVCELEGPLELSERCISPERTVLHMFVDDSAERDVSEERTVFRKVIERDGGEITQFSEERSVTQRPDRVELLNQRLEERKRGRGSPCGSTSSKRSVYEKPPLDRISSFDRKRQRDDAQSFERNSTSNRSFDRRRRKLDDPDSFERYSYSASSTGDPVEAIDPSDEIGTFEQNQRRWDEPYLSDQGSRGGLTEAFDRKRRKLDDPDSIKASSMCDPNDEIGTFERNHRNWDDPYLSDQGSRGVEAFDRKRRKLDDPDSFERYSFKASSMCDPSDEIGTFEQNQRNWDDPYLSDQGSRFSETFDRKESGKVTDSWERGAEDCLKKERALTSGRMLRSTYDDDPSETFDRSERWEVTDSWEQAANAKKERALASGRVLRSTYDDDRSETFGRNENWEVTDSWQQADEDISFLKKERALASGRVLRSTYDDEMMHLSYKGKPWYDSECKLMSESRDAVKMKLLACPSADLLAEYKKSRNLTVGLCRKKKKAYYEAMAEHRSEYGDSRLSIEKADLSDDSFSMSSEDIPLQPKSKLPDFRDRPKYVESNKQADILADNKTNISDLSLDGTFDRNIDALKQNIPLDTGSKVPEPQEKTADILPGPNKAWFDKECKFYNDERHSVRKTLLECPSDGLLTDYKFIRKVARAVCRKKKKQYKREGIEKNEKGREEVVELSSSQLSSKETDLPANDISLEDTFKLIKEHIAEIQLPQDNSECIDGSQGSKQDENVASLDTESKLPDSHDMSGHTDKFPSEKQVDLLTDDISLDDTFDLNADAIEKDITEKQLPQDKSQCIDGSEGSKQDEKLSSLDTESKLPDPQDKSEHADEFLSKKQADLLTDDISLDETFDLNADALREDIAEIKLPQDKSECVDGSHSSKPQDKSGHTEEFLNKKQVDLLTDDISSDEADLNTDVGLPDEDISSNTESKLPDPIPKLEHVDDSCMKIEDAVDISSNVDSKLPEPLHKLECVDESHNSPQGDVLANEKMSLDESFDIYADSLEQDESKASELHDKSKCVDELHSREQDDLLVDDLLEEALGIKAVAVEENISETNLCDKLDSVKESNISKQAVIEADNISLDESFDFDTVADTSAVNNEPKLPEVPSASKGGEEFHSSKPADIEADNISLNETFDFDTDADTSLLNNEPKLPDVPSVSKGVEDLRSSKQADIEADNISLNETFDFDTDTADTPLLNNEPKLPVVPPVSKGGEELNTSKPADIEADNVSLDETFDFDTGADETKVSEVPAVSKEKETFHSIEADNISLDETFDFDTGADETKVSEVPAVSKEKEAFHSTKQADLLADDISLDDTIDLKTDAPEEGVSLGTESKLGRSESEGEVRSSVQADLQAEEISLDGSIGIHDDFVSLSSESPLRKSKTPDDCIVLSPSEDGELTSPKLPKGVLSREIRRGSGEKRKCRKRRRRSPGMHRERSRRSRSTISPRRRSHDILRDRGQRSRSRISHRRRRSPDVLRERGRSRISPKRRSPVLVNRRLRSPDILRDRRRRSRSRISPRRSPDMLRDRRQRSRSRISARRKGSPDIFDYRRQRSRSRDSSRRRRSPDKDRRSRSRDSPEKDQPTDIPPESVPSSNILADGSQGIQAANFQFPMFGQQGMQGFNFAGGYPYYPVMYPNYGQWNMSQMYPGYQALSQPAGQNYASTNLPGLPSSTVNSTIPSVGQGNLPGLKDPSLVNPTTSSFGQGHLPGKKVPLLMNPMVSSMDQGNLPGQKGPSLVNPTTPSFGQGHLPGKKVPLLSNPMVSSMDQGDFPGQKDPRLVNPTISSFGLGNLPGQKDQRLVNTTTSSIGQGRLPGQKDPRLVNPTISSFAQGYLPGQKDASLVNPAMLSIGQGYLPGRKDPRLGQQKLSQTHLGNQAIGQPAGRNHNSTYYPMPPSSTVNPSISSSRSLPGQKDPRLGQRKLSQTYDELPNCPPPPIISDMRNTERGATSPAEVKITDDFIASSQRLQLMHLSQQPPPNFYSRSLWEKK